LTLAPVSDKLPPIDVFLTPISDSAPSGESLRFDPVYDEIRKLREEDDPTLPAGVWQRELKRADWNGVASVCINALTTRSKDLRIAAWLTEAWLHMEAFRGLAHGLRLSSALCRTFWPTLHPELEEGNAESRLSPIAWIADRLQLPVKSVPVSAPQAEGLMPAAWKEWETALYMSNLAVQARAKGQPVKDDGSTAQTNFMTGVGATPAQFFASLADDLSNAISAIDELQSVTVELAGEHDAPSLAPMRALLAAIHTFVARVRSERVETGELAAEAAPFDTGEETPRAAQSPGGSITSRAEAYARLREAADFLARVEPHSPVPYLVRRAIGWGNLSFAELLEELLQRNADISTINALLGIKRPAN
jgi:type VI secretion system protein ImpA